LTECQVFQNRDLRFEVTSFSRSKRLSFYLTRWSLKGLTDLSPTKNDAVNFFKSSNLLDCSDERILIRLKISSMFWNMQAPQVRASVISEEVFCALRHPLSSFQFGPVGTHRECLCQHPEGRLLRDDSRPRQRAVFMVTINTFILIHPL
jgi:hypothetical protein